MISDGAVRIEDMLIAGLVFLLFFFQDTEQKHGKHSFSFSFVLFRCSFFLFTHNDPKAGT